MDTGQTVVRHRSRRSINGVQRTTLCVQLTADERTMLEAMATNTGRSMSRVLVDCALHPTGADDIDPTHLDEVIETLRDYRWQLRGVATNLNQVAHHANTVFEVPADFDATVEDVKALKDQISAALSSVIR